MLRIDDSSHHFHIDTLTPLRQEVEFGNRNLFTTLASGARIDDIETSLAANLPLFNNPAVNQALMISAECVVLMEKSSSPQFPEQFLLRNFEFGFVQGLKASSLDLEFWGRYAVHGRTFVNADMPNGFEVDTDPAITPWTRIAGVRFVIKNVTMASSKFNSLRVTAAFSDHPMYVHRHTLTHPTNNVPNFIRKVSFKREFKTIFCFREKKTGAFTPISSTGWLLHFNHQVSYSGNGTARSVTALNNSHQFPRGGSPSDIDATARQVLSAAKAGSPIVTSASISAAINGATISSEPTNPDFDAAFWT